MASPLSDLDELVLKCRDQKAKSYIREAVACYKSGAFRSSIVSTWIAVSFDIIDKLKDLSLAGDKEAEIQLEGFDKARRVGDIAQSLKFERDILQVCRDKLELISHVEFIDLARLQEDRNRCAHPSMTTDGEIFNPSAELARVHIRSAVEHLLQYPPAQGKYALDALINEVDSEYFPSDKDKAVVSFKSSPLFKARDSLSRNFIIVLLKKIVNDAEDFKEVSRITSALNAVESLHRKIYTKTLKEKLSSIIRSVADDKLNNVMPILERLNDSWSYLDDDVKQKIESYIENLPKEKLDYLDFFFSNVELMGSAQKRLNKATRAELDGALFFGLPNQVADRIVELYSTSRSFDQANSFASTVTRYADDFSLEQIQKIIKACRENDQIEYSFEIGTVLNALRRNKAVVDSEFDEWLKEADLEKFAKKKEEEAEEDS